MKLIIGLAPNIAEVDYFNLDTTYLDCISEAIKVPDTLFVIARSSAAKELMKRAANVICEFYHTTNIDLALDLFFDNDLYVDLYFYYQNELITLKELHKQLEDKMVIGDLSNRTELYHFLSICC